MLESHPACKQPQIFGIFEIASVSALRFPCGVQRLRNTACIAVWLLVVGCESAGEKIRSVNWEFKAEKEQLEPYEQQRQDLEYLARPK